MSVNDSSSQSWAPTGVFTADRIWRNGELVPWAEARVHVSAVGHSSVASFFEGIKAYWNPDRQELYVFRLGEHMERLVQSARMMRVDLAYDAAQLEQAVVELLRANRAHADVYVRPWVFAAGLVREMSVPEGSATECVIDHWPFTSRMLTERGFRCCISTWTRLSDRMMPPRIKAFSNYHNSRLAVVEARHNGYDAPIFLNHRGTVAEGPGACLAMIRKGRMVTPPVTGSILESITRATLLELVPERLGIEVEEREIDRTELYVADEAFFLGTGWEITPIYSVDGIPVGEGRMGPVTSRIDHLYHDVVRGRLGGYEHWLTPVWAGAAAPTAGAR